MTTTIDCSRRIQFCAGHRVMGHESKCAHLHGHNYVVWLRAEIDRSITGADVQAGGDRYADAVRRNAEGVDPIGRVVDFSVLKAKVGQWIEDNWDHGFLYHHADRATIAALDAMNAAMIEDGAKPGNTPWCGQKRFAMPYNPTAENIARYLLEVVGPMTLDGLGVRLVEVSVDETENCSANATLA